jgi:hypothetical protein
MMISYLLFIGHFSQTESILQDQGSNLFHLVRLRLSTLGLQIQNLVDPHPAENMVIAANPLVKPEPFQQGA